MSKILEAIEALTHNATHPKFLVEALKEIKGELDAIKERVEGLDSVKAHAAAASDSAAEAARAAQSASVAANQAALDAKGTPDTRPGLVVLTPAPANVLVNPDPNANGSQSAASVGAVEPAAPVVPVAQAAPAVPPVTA